MNSDFKKRFGLSINEDDLKNEAKKNLVNKINYDIFREIQKTHFYDDNYFHPNLFEFICLKFLLYPSDVIKKFNENRLGFHYGKIVYPQIRYFTEDNLEETLFVVETIYSYFQNEKVEEYIKTIDSKIELLSKQLSFLKIRWRNGKFYPAEAKELSEKLINEPLEWLKDYPKVKSLYKNALDHYSVSVRDNIKRKDVISNSFQAIEELTRNLLNNDKAFDNNFNYLVESLNLNTNWKQIFHYYKELSKEFGRHSGRGENFIPEQSDTESFLYLSGLIMRLILEKLKISKLPNKK